MTSPILRAPGAVAPTAVGRFVRHRATPWALLGVSMALCLGAWYHGERAIRRNAEERFVYAADAVTGLLQQRLRDHDTMLRGAAAFVRATPDVSRARWRAYVASLDMSRSGAADVGLGFAPRVAAEDRQSFEQRLRDEGVADVSIGSRPGAIEHLPLAYVEPESLRRLRAHAGDLAADPSTAEALARAAGAGLPVLLGGESPAVDARLMECLPVYVAGQSPATAEERRRALAGFVIMAFDPADVAAAAAPATHEGLGFVLRDQVTGGVLHRNGIASEAGAVPTFRHARTMAIAGRPWALEFVADRRWYLPGERAMSVAVGLACLLINLVLGLLLLAHRRVRTDAEALVAEKDDALTRSEGAFLAVTESARVAIVLADAQGRFTYANAAAEEMFGVPRAQLVGASSVQYVAAADRQRFREGLEKFVAGEGRISAGAPTPINGLRATGEEFPAEVALSWFDGADGRYITGVIVDHSERVRAEMAALEERRHAEETLRFAREQAEQAARSKSDFLAMMSHELRTPMNGVLGMTNLLSSTTLSEEQREYLDMIGRSGNALLRLIDDILDFSKIEAGRVVIEQVTCDVGAIAREVVTLLGVQAHSRGLQLDAIVAPGTPTIVVTDPGRLRQVLFNLVGNAIKFTEAGSVSVHVGADSVVDGRAVLRVAVSDTGIGIPEDKQRLLFEKFTQADASTTRRFGGTGLGLAISKGLVESLGGRIGVTSVVGQGSQFWFTFKAVVAAGPASEPEPFAGARDEAASYAAPSGLHRVLVAEDNPVNQRVAVRMLEKLGYSVDVAVDGREAVQMARDGRYIAIFMDCHMPELDGFEATRQICQVMPADVRPPILAMTAAASEGDRERCLASGMDDYLRKPVQMPELRAMLERWTRPGGGRTGLGEHALPSV